MILGKTIISIHYLEMEKDTKLELVQELLVSNQTLILDNIFKSESLRCAIGLNEIKSIYDNGSFAYIDLTSDADTSNFSEYEYLLNILQFVEFFFQALWLVKDNSIKSDLGHLIYNSDDGLKIHSNLIHTTYSNCLGKFEKVHFSKEELLIAIELFPIIIVNMTSEEKSHSTTINLSTKVTRLARAIYFLQSARSSIDLGTKLTHYCSILESIFSVSSSELKHRLSETVSLFLASEKDERLTIYKTLQNAYDIRSAIVHGDGVHSKYLKNNNALLVETVQYTDEIIRRSFRKIIASESLYDLFTIKTKDDIVNFNQSLIFK